MNIKASVILALVSLSISILAADRAANYEDALLRAKETGKDIVVLQRGSDWNRLGEELYNKIWNTDDFSHKLGDLSLIHI